MGAFFSSPLAVVPPPVVPVDDPEGPPLESSKRVRLTDEAQIAAEDKRLQLIPGLPDEIALECLAWLGRSNHPKARQVCKSWREALGSKELYDCRRELRCTEEWLYLLLKDEDQRLTWRMLDPVANLWSKMPQMPTPRDPEPRDPTAQRSLWWNPFANSRSRLPNLLNVFHGSVEAAPFCGCTPAASNGILYVIGGFYSGQAIPRVLMYNPRTNSWEEGPTLTVPRAYCKAGTLDGRIYAVGGVHRTPGGLEPLPSAEVFDPKVGEWRRMPNMTFSRAPSLPAAFLTDVLRPTATGLAVAGGRICVTQSLYHWPFFIDIGGEVFDPKSETWSEMPQGMGEGWPVKQGGTKLSAVVDDRIYGLDPNNNRGGLVRSYDAEMDAWRRVALKPLPLEINDLETPYLLACLRGHLYLLVKDAARCITVSAADVAKLSDARWLDGEEDLWRQVSRRRFGRSDLVVCEVMAC